MPDEETVERAHQDEAEGRARGARLRGAAARKAARTRSRR